MKTFLRAHDPADVDGRRLERTLSAVLSGLDAQPQPVRPILWGPSAPFASFSRALTAGLVFLSLGFFAGNQMFFPRGQTEKVSVYAAAEPWENLVVGE